VSNSVKIGPDMPGLQVVRSEEPSAPVAPVVSIPQSDIPVGADGIALAPKMGSNGQFLPSVYRNSGGDLVRDN
jgi:hypothetical protein